MAKAPAAAAAKPSIVAKVKLFYQEVKSEMSKVVWPSREELKSSTSVVMMMLAILCVIVFFYDQIFTFIFKRLMSFG